MKIGTLKINHLTNPVGYSLENPTISYVACDAKGKKQASAQIIVAGDEDFAEVIYDSGDREDIVSTGFELPVILKPMKRYYWKVKVTDDAGETGVSETAYFETPRSSSWRADWITPCLSKEIQAVVFKDIILSEKPKAARAYISGLGLYEFYLNGIKQGEECLLPGFCDYDSWIQYQTFELEMNEGANRFEIALADGWYKGRYGINPDYTEENYGDRLAAIAEIYVWYEDGREELYCTGTDWRARKSKVTQSSIYNGEVLDMMLDVSEAFNTEVIQIDKGKLSPRLSPPITVHERVKPTGLIKTPAGEDVLDMGQNMTGWLTFKCNAPAGTVFKLQFGEILQDGNFYNDNLRTAKAEFIYISDGEERLVRQHFTFYGFRYVRLTEWYGDININAFEGWEIHSRMDETGRIETSDSLVNQLISNVRWGMKDNFLDVPTDCPQRDERYGWTGDAQIFSGTACFMMDTAAFYTKYCHDLSMEQKKLGGSVPDVVPVAHVVGDASTVWADAATVIPWNVYLHFGDSAILRRQYNSMKSWVDYMKREDDRNGAKRLWQTGTHYADWVALDGNYKGGVFGGTDQHYIASANYYNSSRIVSEAAGVLGKDKDAAFYAGLAEEIKTAFLREYFTPAGRLAVDTMTGYVYAFYFGLMPEGAEDVVREGLMNKLRKSRYHLQTGFAGTPYLCRVLSEHGMNDLAYHLLLEKGYPGWLYAVLMGATTVWERWNSVEPDGHMSGTEMNSLNHYSYGSIVEWIYRNMLGINPLSVGAGFKRFCLSPEPNYQIENASASLESASGLIRSSWKLNNGELCFEFTVPFDTEAEIILPDADITALEEQARVQDGLSSMRQKGRNVAMRAVAGEYRFTYKPTRPYRKVFSFDTPFKELMADPGAKTILDEEYFTYVNHVPFEDELYTFKEMLDGPFTNVPFEVKERIAERLREL